VYKNGTLSDPQQYCQTVNWRPVLSDP